ncbi:hypothetical protein HBB16_14455 [Pseudonocardia sp. MCCB 268]|nr:hypothetical protein [Pseudonocardia cytotoxica]
MRAHAPELPAALLPRPAQRVPADLHPARHDDHRVHLGRRRAPRRDRRATSVNLIAQKDLVKVMAIDDTSAAPSARLGRARCAHAQAVRGRGGAVREGRGALISQTARSAGCPRSCGRTWVRRCRVRCGVAAVRRLRRVRRRPGPDRDVLIPRAASRNRSGYASIGSGSAFAEGSLKKRHRPGLDRRRDRARGQFALWTPPTTTPRPPGPT